MTAQPTGTLYNREILRLATELARWPLSADLPLRATRRSRICGSATDIGLEVDASGRIAGVGMTVQACALGQASAAVLARNAIGRSADDMASARLAIARMIGAEEGDPIDLSDWEMVDHLALTRGYPGRHPAVLLPFDAAIAALAEDRT